MFDRLMLLAKAKFRQLLSIYRPGKLSMEQILAKTATREDVPSQLLTMAKKFDINEHNISQPNWRGVWAVENCNTCWAGKFCFKDHDGNQQEKPGLITNRCPNSAIFQCIAAEKQAAEQEKSDEKDLERHIREQLYLSKLS